MRVLAVSLVLALAPAALAQAPDLQLVTLEADPFEAPVDPLQAPATITLHARVSCALIRSPAGATLHYAVTSAPPWTSATISPASDAIALAECDDGWATREAELVVQATDQAPAFRPTGIVVEVRVNEADAASANVTLVASYFSILDVQVQESIAVVRPGETKAFALVVQNRGNGATLVRLDGALVSSGLTLDLPAPLALGSKQQGAADSERRVDVRVTAPDAKGFVNEVGTVNVNLTSLSDEDPSRSGDASSISFLVTTRSSIRDVPAPWVVVLTAALSLGAALRRRPA